MKNILAENLLRFGLKNADVDVVNKLQSLSEQSTSIQRFLKNNDTKIQKIRKIEPKLAELLNTTTNASSGGVTIVGDYFVIEFSTNEEPGGDGTGLSYQDGAYNLYEVGTYAGLPWVLWKGTTTARNGINLDDLEIYDRGRIDWKMIDGNTTTEKLNNLWNDSGFQPVVIKKALEYIQKNQAKFKAAFHKFTRSEYAIKNYWNGFQYDFFMDKLKGTAKLVIDLVQDDELIDHIEFKKQNPRSDGKYPELNIPAAV